MVYASAVQPIYSQEISVYPDESESLNSFVITMNLSVFLAKKMER